MENNRTVMIVEDEKIVAEDICDRLVSLGYSVPAIAISGEEAIELARKTRPDIILMDIRLKGAMDGTEAARRIRSFFDVPIIYLTAYADEQTFQRAMFTDPFGYLLKPLENRELHTSIEMAFFKHQMERKLKESEQWLATTLKSIGDAVIATDAGGCVKFMNPVAEALTGWKQEDALGRQLSDVFDSTNTIRPEGNENRSSQDLQEALLGSMPTHTVFLSKNGMEIPVDDNIAPIRDDRGAITGLVVIFKDATDRHRAEAALRNVSKRIREAQEMERKRVARELHDSVIQILSSAKFRLNMLEEKTASSGKKVGKDKDFESVRAVIEKAIGEVRRISHNLRPSELDDLGLLPAIRLACEDFRERTGILVSTQLSRFPRELSQEASLATYRIIQEGLCNIEKHADARCVELTLSMEDSSIRLILKDDGKGFNPATLKSRKQRDSGLGFINMMERVKFVGGMLEVDSAPGRGTTLSVLIPSTFHEG